MTTRDFEQGTSLTERAVTEVLCRAAVLVDDPVVEVTGVLELEDSITQDVVRITFDKENVLSGIFVHLKDPVRHLRFDPDGTVVREFKRGGESVIYDSGEVSPYLSPKERRLAVGYIATAHELFNDLVDSRYAPTETA